MTTYTYNLIDTGVEILADGALFIRQTFDPSKGYGVPFSSPADAEAYAKAYIAAATPPATPPTA